MEQFLDIFAGRTALAIAHPGHELRVFGWMQRAKPLVLVLTDGSGGRSSSRLASTERIMRQTGGRQSGFFGRFPDRQIYQAVLQGNTQLFLNVATEVAHELVQNDIEIVVGDAAERAILTHDLWRGVVNRAIGLAEQEMDRPLASFEFSLDEAIPAAAIPAAFKLELSDAELQAKISAARSYRELAQEVEAVIASHGEEGLREETFLHAQSDELLASDHQPPRYELHGERQVAAGLYSQVVRYQRHVFPILRALQSGRERARNKRQLLEAA